MTVTFFNQTTTTEQAEALITKIFESIEEKHEMNIIFLTNDDIRKMIIEISIKSQMSLVFLIKKTIISVIYLFHLKKAKEQALDYGHSIEREIGFLSVHGYLHLLGV